MPAPQITRITPFEVAIGATTALTMTGLGLTGATLNVPGGTLASSIVITDTQITFSLQVPLGKPGSAHFVSAVTSNGESNKIQLNYMPQAMETPYPLDYLHTGA